MLFRYSEFNSNLKINENVAGAKKILKDTFVLNKAVKELSTDRGTKTDPSGMFLLDKDGVSINFNDLPEEIKGEARKKVREIKLSEDELRQVERHPKFQEIRDLLGDKLGWAQMFTYLYFKERTDISELKGIFDDLITYGDLLNKLRRPISNYIDANITNNTEQLIDDIEDIKRYRKLKKFIDEFNSDLKRDYANSPKFFKDKLMDIAGAFDELGKDNDTNRIDFEKQRTIQKRFFDKIGRYKTIRELTAGAELFLKSESNADVVKFYEAIDKCNKKYGDYGVKVMYDDGGLLIMEVKSFAACKDLFSNTSWCIAQYLGQWNSYVGGDDVYTKQYSIINFNLAPSNNESIIGITIAPKQAVKACHLKNDAGASGTFQGIFNKFEKELGLEKGFIWSGLEPMTDAEISEKKRRIVANREVIKKGLSLEDLKKYIVEDGADVNAGNGAALDNAVADDNIEKVEFLLDYGASANLRSRQEATVNKVKSFDILKLLISKGADITPQVFKSLVEDEDAVKFCLDNGLDPNFEDNMPLRIAVKNGKLNLVRLLEEYDVNSDNRRQMNTKHAAEYQHWDILEYFISKGGSYTQGFEQVLKWCGHTRKIQPDAKKLEVLDKLQEYIDSGKVTCSEQNYKIGNKRDSSLKEVLEKFGNIRNWVVDSHDDLKKIDK
jgi:ankyrin repeat protein